jgi:hypothetical protein
VTHRGPVVTALVVVAGLVGFMTANSAGALVATKAGDQKGDVQVPAPPGDAQGSGKPGQKAPAKPPKTSEPAEPSEESPEKPEAPAAPTFPAEAVYTGDATGSNLAIAVAVKGDQASAYLCDGAAVEDWLKGTAEAGEVDLTSKNGKSSLTASLEGKRLVGEVTLRGQTLPFSIAVGAPPTGLYRGENGKTTVGWIILPNGQQVGIANSDGAEAPAPELDPDKGFVTVDGQRIDAEEITGESTWG